jgi:hypothetical protein
MKVRRTAITAAAALVGCCVLGMAPAAAQVSSAVTPTWAKQAPAAHPSSRFAASMAYDADTGTVVLYGGAGTGSPSKNLGDTWTWDGTTWTRQHPPTSPPVLNYASMAYDPGTGTVVMFGGAAGAFGSVTNATWTWDGTTWTLQSPAASPGARVYASMAYDAATSTSVLFGGFNDTTNFTDTWTWG